MDTILNICQLNHENKDESEPIFIPSNIFNDNFQNAVKIGNINYVKIFMNNLFSNKFVAQDDNKALCTAAQENHFEIVEYLLSFQPVKDNAHCKGNYILRWASYYGYIYIVILLLKLPNVSATANYLNNQALYYACMNEHRTVVEYLLRIPVIRNNITDEIRMKALIHNQQNEITNNISEFQNSSTTIYTMITNITN